MERNATLEESHRAAMASCERRIAEEQEKARQTATQLDAALTRTAAMEALLHEVHATMEAAYERQSRMKEDLDAARSKGASAAATAEEAGQRARQWQEESETHVRDANSMREALRSEAARLKEAHGSLARLTEVVEVRAFSGTAGAIAHAPVP